MCDHRLNGQLHDLEHYRALRIYSYSLPSNLYPFTSEYTPRALDTKRWFRYLKQSFNEKEISDMVETKAEETAIVINYQSHRDRR